MSDPIQSIEAISGAVEETAKTTGKAIDLVHGAGRWVDGKLGSAIEDIIGLTIGDKLSEARMARQIRTRERLLNLAHDAQLRLAERGIRNVQQPPDKILTPLLEAASVEDEPELQKLWSELLASALSHEEAVTRVYVSILADLSVIGARALRDYFLETGGAKGQVTRERGWSYVGETLDGDHYGVDVARELARLGLIEPALIRFRAAQEQDIAQAFPADVIEITVPGDLYRIVMTELGREFCEAVGMIGSKKAPEAELDL